MTTQNTEELEAAELEGILPMPEHLVAKRAEWLALKEQIDELTAVKNAIRDEFGEAMEQAGAQGFLLHGKVHSRRSTVTSHTVDSKRLKAEMPSIFAKFLKTTKTVRVTIN